MGKQTLACPPVVRGVKSWFRRRRSRDQQHYENEKPWFTLECQHGGRFGNLPWKAYVGDYTDWYDSCHREKFGIHDIHEMVEELGYSGYINYFWKIPVVLDDLEGIVCELKTERDVLKMIETNLPGNHVIIVFLEELCECEMVQYESREMKKIAQYLQEVQLSRVQFLLQEIESEVGGSVIECPRNNEILALEGPINVHRDGIQLALEGPSIVHVDFQVLVAATIVVDKVGLDSVDVAVDVNEVVQVNEVREVNEAGEIIEDGEVNDNLENQDVLTPKQKIDKEKEKSKKSKKSKSSGSILDFMNWDTTNSDDEARLKVGQKNVDFGISFFEVMKMLRDEQIAVREQEAERRREHEASTSKVGASRIDSNEEDVFFNDGGLWNDHDSYDEDGGSEHETDDGMNMAYADSDNDKENDKENDVYNDKENDVYNDKENDEELSDPDDEVFMGTSYIDSRSCDSEFHDEENDVLGEDDEFEINVTIDDSMHRSVSEPWSRELNEEENGPDAEDNGPNAEDNGLPDNDDNGSDNEPDNDDNEPHNEENDTRSVKNGLCAMRVSFEDCETSEESDLDLRSIHSDDSESEERYPFFNPVFDMVKPKFKLRHIFSSFDVFKKALRQYSTRNRVAATFEKNDKSRVTVKCCKGCPWSITARKVRGGPRVQVRAYNDVHVCARRTRLVAAKYNWIARAYIDTIRSQPDISISTLCDHIQRDHQLQVHRSKVHKAKTLALDLIRGDEEGQYKRLADYGAGLEKTDEGSKLYLSMDNLVFKRMFVYFGGCKHGFLTGCRPIISVDGCFLKGRYGGQLLAAVGIGVNDCIWPIAFAVVETESQDLWSWFLSLLSDELGF